MPIIESNKTPKFKVLGDCEYNFQNILRFETKFSKLENITSMQKELMTVSSLSHTTHYIVIYVETLDEILSYFLSKYLKYSIFNIFFSNFV